VKIELKFWKENQIRTEITLIKNSKQSEIGTEQQNDKNVRAK
jgi:hypothetical protein